MSSMITGPANFPVRKAEKANEAENNRWKELYVFQQNLEKYALKSLDKVYSTHEKQCEEIEALKRDIAASEKSHEHMKQANKLIRAKKYDELKELMPNHYEALLKPNYMGKQGFETWELSNNLANIKRKKQRLKELEAKNNAAQEYGELEQELNGLKIVRNFTEDRLQLIFDGKPEASIRKLLKSHGFRWSPRFGAWQRKLTKNALYVTKNHLLKTEEFKAFV